MHLRRLPWAGLGIAMSGLLFAAAPASAQGVGFQGGGTASPNQWYVGSHFEIPLGLDQFLLRPGVEGGRGDGLSLASVSFEFLYTYEFAGTPWTIFQGTGPAVNFARFDDTTTTSGGVNLVVGLAHQRGFFTEMKIGGSGSASLRYGVGYTIRFGGATPPAGP